MKRERIRKIGLKLNLINHYLVGRTYLERRGTKVLRYFRSNNSQKKTGTLSFWLLHSCTSEIPANPQDNSQILMVFRL